MMRKWMVLFFLVIGCALSATAQLISSGKMEMKAVTKGIPTDVTVKLYIDQCWGKFNVPEQEPVASVLAHREEISRYIRQNATKGIEFADVYNGTRAIQAILQYCTSHDAVTVKKLSGLDRILAGVDINSEQIIYCDAFGRTVDDYYQLKYVIEGAPVNEARGNIMFSTLVLENGNEYTYRRYREILEQGNDSLTLNYLTCLTNVFYFHGYTRGLQEIRPDIEKLMPEGKLKQELMAAYEKYYAFRDGIQAPAFKMDSYDNKGYALEDFKGKVLVVDVWATWCSGCVKKLPAFLEMAAKYAGLDDIEFITISIDDERATQKWKDGVVKYNLTGMKNLIVGKSDKSFRSGYNVFGIPRYFLIDKNGVGVTIYAPTPGAAFEKMINETLKK